MKLKEWRIKVTFGRHFVVANLKQSKNSLTTSLLAATSSQSSGGKYKISACIGAHHGEHSNFDTCKAFWN